MQLIVRVPSLYFAVDQDRAPMLLDLLMHCSVVEPHHSPDYRTEYFERTGHEMGLQLIQDANLRNPPPPEIVAKPSPYPVVADPS